MTSQEQLAECRKKLAEQKTRCSITTEPPRTCANCMNQGDDKVFECDESKGPCDQHVSPWRPQEPCPVCGVPMEWEQPGYEEGGGDGWWYCDNSDCPTDERPTLDDKSFGKTIARTDLPLAIAALEAVLDLAESQLGPDKLGNVYSECIITKVYVALIPA